MSDRCWNALALAVLLCCCLLVTGCGERIVRATAEHVADQAADQAGPMPDSSPAGESIELAHARAQLAQKQAELAAAEALVAGLEQAADEARREGQRRVLAWASGIVILGMLACAALAVFLPLLRTKLLLGVAAGGAVLVLAQTITASLAWLPIVGSVIVFSAIIAGLAWCVWMLWQRLRAAVRSVHLLADRNDPSWEAMKALLLQAQGGEGHPIQRDLDRLSKQEPRHEPA